MGLDVYVGSLTRYYGGDWETIVQQAGREQGLPVHVVRPGAAPKNAAPGDEHADEFQKDLEAVVRKLSNDLGVQAVIQDPGQPQGGRPAATKPPDIDAWRTELAASLRNAGFAGKLDWQDTADAPYVTDKPGWDCFGALLLLAAYEEGEKPLLGSRWPKKLATNWQEDARLRERLNARTQPRYAHLYGCEIWLPIDVQGPFSGPRPTGQPTLIGSSLRLLEELRLLNQRSYRGISDDLAAWRRNMPEGDDQRFEPKAKTGLAIMLELTSAAVEHRLPMLLDY